MADVKARLLTLLFSIIMSLNVIHPKALNVPWELLEKWKKKVVSTIDNIHTKIFYDKYFKDKGLDTIHMNSTN